MAQVFIEYEDQRRLITLPPTFEGLLVVARPYLSISTAVGLHPRYCPGPGERPVDLNEGNYNIVRDCTFITFNRSAGPATPGPVDATEDLPDAPALELEVAPDVEIPAPSQTLLVPPPNKVVIIYDQSCRFMLHLPNQGFTSIFALRDMICERTGYDETFFGLTYNHYPLADSTKTLHHYGIREGDVIKVDTSFGVARHSVYLMRPTTARTDLKLSLTVSCVPPFAVRKGHLPVDIAPQQSCSWDVSVGKKSDRRPHIIDTDRNPFYYLSWTGDTSLDPNRLSRRIEQAAPRGNTFNPSAPSLVPENAHVLRVGDFVPFLEHALEKLSLCAQIRTDFILNHSDQLRDIAYYFRHIAFRFVSQDAVSTASTIGVRFQAPAPTPALSRIFMLFGGVMLPHEGVNKWKRAQLTLEGARSLDWVAEAGLDVASMFDEKRLRVIEVGSMEVPLFD